MKSNIEEKSELIATFIVNARKSNSVDLSLVSDDKFKKQIQRCLAFLDTLMTARSGLGETRTKAEMVARVPYLPFSQSTKAHLTNDFKKFEHSGRRMRDWELDRSVLKTLYTHFVKKDGKSYTINPMGLSFLADVFTAFSGDGSRQFAAARAVVLVILSDEEITAISEQVSNVKTHTPSAKVNPTKHSAPSSSLKMAQTNSPKPKPTKPKPRSRSSNNQTPKAVRKTPILSKLAFLIIGEVARLNWISIALMLALNIAAFTAVISIMEAHRPLGNEIYAVGLGVVGILIGIAAIVVAGVIVRGNWGRSRLQEVLLVLGALGCVGAALGNIDTFNSIDRNNRLYFKSVEEEQSRRLAELQAAEQRRIAEQQRQDRLAAERAARRINRGDTVYLCLQGGGYHPVIAITANEGAENIQIEPVNSFLIGNWFNNKTYYPGSFYWFPAYSIEKYSSDC
jgi:hypothetical protein